MITTFFLIHLAGFLLGSVPVGYLIAKLKGIDIRRVGSGNIGATNVGRSIGKKAGILTLLGDVAKGAAGVLLVELLPVTHSGPVQVFVHELGASVGFCAILGHCYSPFLRWNGGKGVATSLGVFAVLAPWEALIAVGVFAVVAAVGRYVSLASISAAMSLPIMYWYRQMYSEGQGSKFVLLAATCTALLIVLRHRANIARLTAGHEIKL